MNLQRHLTPDEANAAAAGVLAQWLTSGARNVMLAAGNTPLDLYRRIAERSLSLSTCLPSTISNKSIRVAFTFSAVVKENTWLANRDSPCISASTDHQ